MLGELSVELIETDTSKLLNKNMIYSITLLN